MSDQEEELLPTIHGYDSLGNEYNEVLRTKSGKIITEADIDQWVADAEEGYEVSHEFQPILAGETRRPSDEPNCAECGKRKSLHVILKPRRLVIGHDSEFECDECGGPSPATSMQGCQWCGGQGDIVSRGTAKFRTWNG